ncbi:MAG TPA: NAD(P)/FAD-dependent oxidoreductase [Bacteroidales bacterium]|nr:NAD(P)/FAD-dependent oxidoreductase [Bacteroidales bacterium]
MNPYEQVAIIGGGPAGVACAVQLKRYGIDPLLFEKDRIGGLVKNAWRLDNYPGFPDGITGPAMARKLEEHLERFDIRHSLVEIRNAEHTGAHFTLTSAKGKINCNYLVIASGTRSRFSVPRGSENIYTEVYPLRDLKGETIHIIGAGDAAFDYAMTLATHNKVIIHNRGTNIKCIPALHEIACRQPNIEYRENSMPPFSRDYTIFATGREAELSFVQEHMKKNRHQLEHDGLLYVIGDVINGMVRQTSVAVGDGIRAAMAIREKIANEGNQQNAGT